MVRTSGRISEPSDTGLPKTNPEQHVIDLTFILQTVTDQSKNFGALQQELVHLKETTTKYCSSVDNQGQRIVAIETILHRMERDFDKFPDTLKSSVDEIRRLIESSVVAQKEHLDLKLTPIAKSVDELKSDNKEKFEKINLKIDDLNQFRWKAFGVTVALASVISIIATFAARAVFS